MFGIGSIVGKLAGGVLEKVGLGKIAPFVSMGLNAMTGNWLGVAKDVFGMVSNFKGNNFQNNASQLPPLGGFDNGSQTQPWQSESNLGRSRMTDLFRGLSDLFRGTRQLTDANPRNDFGGLGRIFNAFRSLSDAFGNGQLFSNRLSTAQFSNMQA